MRLLRMPRLHNQKLTKPGVHSIARTLLRCTYAKIAAEIVKRRKHSDDMKAFALKLAARTVLPVERWNCWNCPHVGIVVLRKTNGVEHRLELHSRITFRQIYQMAREVLDLPAGKSYTSFYSDNLLGARRQCTWEALAQVPCNDCLCSRWLAGTVLGVVTYKPKRSSETADSPKRDESSETEC